MNSSQSPRSTALSQIEPHEIEEAQKRFPGLRFIPSGRETRITGELSFAGSYDKKRNTYSFHTYGFSDNTPDPNLIEDSFNIEITTGPGVNPFRNVCIKDSRFDKYAKELGLHLEDLHIYSKSKMICINGYLDEDQNIGLLEFLVEKVAKSLYDITFFYKFKYWPSGEFAHGATGILENYFLLSQKRDSDMIQISKKCLETLEGIQNNDRNGVAHFKEAMVSKNPNSGKISHKHKVDPNIKCCTCKTESGMMYRRMADCHPNAFAGLKILKRILRQNPNLSTIT